MGLLAARITVPRGSPVWKDYDGPDAKALEITYETSSKQELWLEEEGGAAQFGKLRMTGTDAKASVAPGKYLLLFRGKTRTPNEEFSIEITEPKEAKWKPKPPERSDARNNIAGLEPFRIDP